MKKMLGRPGGTSALGTKNGGTLPKTGAVCRQWVRCGRPNCRCARGEPHGPYHYLFWREGGRLHKRYVRVADADAARAACDERRARERRAGQTVRGWRREWRALTVLLREIERHG